MHQQQYFDNSVSTFVKKKKKMKFPLHDLKTSTKVTFKSASPGKPASLTPGIFPLVAMSFSAFKLWHAHSGTYVSAAYTLRVTVKTLSPKKHKPPFTQFKIVFLERITDH